MRRSPPADVSPETPALTTSYLSPAASRRFCSRAGYACVGLEAETCGEAVAEDHDARPRRRGRGRPAQPPGTRRPGARSDRAITGEHDAAAAARRQTPSDLIIVRLGPVPRAKRSRARACAGARPTGRRRARCAPAPASARASAVGRAPRAHPWSAGGRDVAIARRFRLLELDVFALEAAGHGERLQYPTEMPIAHDAVAARRARLQDSLSLSPGPLEQAIRTYRAIASRAAAGLFGRDASVWSSDAGRAAENRQPARLAHLTRAAWPMQSASSRTLPAASGAARSTTWSCSAWADRVSRPKSCGRFSAWRRAGRASG